MTSGVRDRWLNFDIQNETMSKMCHQNAYSGLLRRMRDGRGPKTAGSNDAKMRWGLSVLRMRSLRANSLCRSPSTVGLVSRACIRSESYKPPSFRKMVVPNARQCPVRIELLLVNPSIPRNPVVISIVVRSWRRSVGPFMVKKLTLPSWENSTYPSLYAEHDMASLSHFTRSRSETLHLAYIYHARCHITRRLTVWTCTTDVRLNSLSDIPPLQSQMCFQLRGELGEL